MPLDFSRRLVGRQRTPGGNRQLGWTLAFVAGAMNAGGYLAVRQYTSHMSGVVSAMADNLVLGDGTLVVAGLGALLSFLAGAISSAAMVVQCRLRGLHSEYAAPLLVEALLLLCFGMVGARLTHASLGALQATVMLLCFIMGLQNAVITKLSHAEIRTTHLTGIVTDIGIELGRCLGGRAGVGLATERLQLLLGLLLSFFGGGVVGAWGFQHAGFIATVPLALILVALASVPVVDDVINWQRDQR